MGIQWCSCIHLCKLTNPHGNILSCDSQYNGLWVARKTCQKMQCMSIMPDYAEIHLSYFVKLFSVCLGY